MPALYFASLGSGSRGNATLVEADDQRVLIDCGFTIKETESRLQRLGVSADSLTALLVTHEHGDHSKGVGRLARKYQLPVFCSFGTFHAVSSGRNAIDNASFHEIRPGRCFHIGSLEVLPVAVPHDAKEPCQFLLSYAAKTLGILTDLGSITEHVVAAYMPCDALLLECNHDPTMLANGPYPESLKRRVGGHLGHLNNQQSAQLLQRLDVPRLQHVALSHISEKNNTTALALMAVSPYFSPQQLEQSVFIASQQAGFEWRTIN